MLTYFNMIGIDRIDQSTDQPIKLTVIEADRSKPVLEPLRSVLPTGPYISTDDAEPESSLQPVPCHQPYAADTTHSVSTYSPPAGMCRLHFAVTSTTTASRGTTGFHRQPVSHVITWGISSLTNWMVYTFLSLPPTLAYCSFSFASK